MREEEQPATEHFPALIILSTAALTRRCFAIFLAAGVRTFPVEESAQGSMSGVAAIVIDVVLDVVVVVIIVVVVTAGDGSPTILLFFLFM